MWRQSGSTSSTYSRPNSSLSWPRSPERFSSRSTQRANSVRCISAEFEEHLGCDGAVAGEVEGLDRVAEREGVGDDRGDVDPVREPRNRGVELVVEAESASERQLPGHQDVPREAGVAGW